MKALDRVALGRRRPLFLATNAIRYTNKGPLATKGAWNFGTVFCWWLIWFSVIAYCMIAYVRAQMSVRRSISAAPSMMGGASAGV